MKNYAYLLLVSFLLSFAFPLEAQNEDNAPITYGEISEEDFNFNISDYPKFDPTSSVIILCDYGQEFYSEYASSWQTRTVYHRRLMILKKEGLNVADVNIVFRADDNSYSLESALSKAGKYGPFWINGEGQGVFKLKASSYYIDDNGEVIRTDLDKNEVYQNDMSEKYGFDAISFGVPNVQVGSIIEYTYTVVQTRFLLSRRWYFQFDYPCLHSEFRIAYNELHTYALIRNGLMRRYIQPIESNLTTQQFREHKQLVYKFELDNIPAMVDQELVTSMDNYRTNILIQIQRYWDYRLGVYADIISSWEELAKTALKEPGFGKQMFKHDQMFENLRETLGEGESDIEEIEMCYNYTRDYFLWNGLYTRSTENNLKQIYSTKYASSVEINLFLCRLLREYGINSKLTYTSIRSNGWINENYPFILQFNHVVCLIEIDGKTYFLDAINKQRPFTLPPANLLDTKAFILDYNEPQIKMIDTDFIFDKMSVINADVKDGKIKAKYQTRFKAYAALEYRLIYAKDSSNFIKDYLLNATADYEIENPIVVNFKEKEKPLLCQCEFTTSEGLQRFDSLLVVDMSSLLPELKNPLSAESRNFPVELNFKRNVQNIISINIPEGYKANILPENFKLALDDGSAVVTSTYRVQNNTLQIMVVLRTNRLVYDIDDYQKLKEIFNSWINIIHTPISFIKI